MSSRVAARPGAGAGRDPRAGERTQLQGRAQRARHVSGRRGPARQRVRGDGGRGGSGRRGPRGGRGGGGHRGGLSRHARDGRRCARGREAAVARARAGREPAGGVRDGRLCAVDRRRYEARRSRAGPRRGRRGGPGRGQGRAAVRGRGAGDRGEPGEARIPAIPGRRPRVRFALARVPRRGHGRDGRSWRRRGAELARRRVDRREPRGGGVGRTIRRDRQARNPGRGRGRAPPAGRALRRDRLERRRAIDARRHPPPSHRDARGGRGRTAGRAAGEPVPADRGGGGLPAHGAGAAHRQDRAGGATRGPRRRASVPTRPTW